MGMYDYVNVEVEWDGLPKSNDYQTKDFGCELTTYTITADGRLQGFGEDMDYHGIFYLSHYQAENDEILLVFKVKFTDGQLVEVKQI